METLNIKISNGNLEMNRKKSSKTRKKGMIALTDNSIKVLERRYLKKDESGNPIEKPEDMFHRVAKNIASADSVYDKDADVKSLMKSSSTSVILTPVARIFSFVIP